MSKRKLESLSTNNPKIIKFYNDHESLDFDETILSFINIIEKLEDNVQNNPSNNSIQNILSEIKSIKSEISTNYKDSSQFFSQQFSDFKREYINDLRLNLTSNVSDKIEPLIKEQIQILFQKTESLIPKQNLELQNKFQESFKIINKDTERFMKSTITESSLQTFISQIDQKLTSQLFNTQQQISQNMSNQEQRLDQKITDISDKTNSQNNLSQTLNTQVGDLLKKLENSSAKGKLSENIIVNILHSLYPTSQIDHVGQTKETGDIILSRKDKPKILIENKDWGKNVVQEEVKKFLHDIETQNCCGVFLSQNYGIANKENFEINIHDGNVLIYVHEANNEPEKIKLAIDIIDHFKLKLDNFKEDTNVDSIPKDILDSINSEYQAFIANKLTLIKIIKDFNQKILKQLDDTKIPSLEEYLSTRYATSTSKFVCEYCGFVAKNAAAKSAHLRGCSTKKSNYISPPSINIKMK
tara:strand:- start:8764 stop:10173 length:1410 start_codon:yes stop_codon:yes gene_type:complete